MSPVKTQSKVHLSQPNDNQRVSAIFSDSPYGRRQMPLPTWKSFKISICAILTQTDVASDKNWFYPELVGLGLILLNGFVWQKILLRRQSYTFKFGSGCFLKNV
jgi:hypothetical protein